MAVALRPTGGELRRGGFGWSRPSWRQGLADRTEPWRYQGRHRRGPLSWRERRRTRAQANRERLVLDYIVQRRMSSSLAGQRPGPPRGVHTPLPPVWHRRNRAQVERRRAAQEYVWAQHSPPRLKDKPLGRSIYRRTNEGMRASAIYRGNDADHIRAQARPIVRQRAKGWHQSAADRRHRPRSRKPRRISGSNVIWPPGQVVHVDNAKVTAGATGVIASAVSDAHLPGMGVLAGAAAGNGSGNEPGKRVGGKGMASSEEVQATVDEAVGKFDEAIGQLEGTESPIDEGVQLLEEAAQGSGITAFQEAVEKANEAKTKLGEVREAIEEAKSKAEDAKGQL
jgi:uncharacterized protein YukE